MDPTQGEPDESGYYEQRVLEFGAGLRPRRGPDRRSPRDDSTSDEIASGFGRPTVNVSTGSGDPRRARRSANRLVNEIRLFCMDGGGCCATGMATPHDVGGPAWFSQQAQSPRAAARPCLQANTAIPVGEIDMDHPARNSASDDAQHKTGHHKQQACHPSDRDR